MNFTVRLYSLFVLGSLLLTACSGSKEQVSPPNQHVLARTAVEEERRARALQHFIDGAIFDAKEEYARAILEYQEALKWDPQPAIHYALAKDYAALGKHATAAEHAREAVRLDSTNVIYHETLADLYINTYQNELAIAEYEQIVRLDSTSTEAWYTLARLYQPSKPLRALEIYEWLLEQNGESWEVLLQAAELYRSLGRYDEAAEKYRRMVEIDPSNKPLQRQLAEVYGRAGKLDEALKILESLFEIDNNDLDILAALADLYLDRNDYRKALDLYQKLLQREGKNPEVKLRVGMAYYGMVQRDTTLIPKAKSVFEEVVRELPNDWRAPLHLGALALMEKNDSVASSYFERVTTLASWNADAWWFLGNIYFEHGEYRKVVDLMERAIQSAPKDYRLYLLSGMAYSQLGLPNQAAATLEKSLALNPNDLNTLGSLALTYDGMKQFPKSDSLYERALQLDPNAHLILNNYSYSLAERDLQLHRALEMAQRAVAAEPNNASYLDTLGWIYYKLGRWKEAEQYISEAVKTGHASAVVHEHLGDVYFQLGNKTMAVEYWKKALQMNGTNQALREKIQRGSL
jgi:tetratricopeptide (TPR) repeat protein